MNGVFPPPPPRWVEMHGGGIIYNTTDNNTENSTVVCVSFPIRVNSVGALEGQNPLTYSMPTTEIQLIFIVGLTYLLHFPLKRLGIPKVLSEILAGIILGATFLGRYEKYQNFMFPIGSQGIIGLLSSFGYMLFLFLSGVKMDVGMVTKTGTKAIVIGVLNQLTPLTIGLVSMQLLVGPHGQIGNWAVNNLPTLMAVHSMTAFPVIAFLLKELKLLNSELGRLALSSALISDLFNVTIRVLCIMLGIGRQHSADRAVADLIHCIFFVLVIIFVVRPAMIWVAKQTPEGRPVDDLHTYLIILVLFLCALFSHYFELTALFGTFIFGLAVPEGPPLGSALVDKLDSFSSVLLLPVFISFTAMRTNLRTIDLRPAYAYSNVFLVVFTFLAKLVGCLLPARYSGMPFTDSLALSLIMSAKGVVDLAAYSFLRDDQTINEDIFAVMVVYIAVNAGLVPVLVKALYDPSRKYAGYQKRNVMHSKHNGKLPILACIHQPDNIVAITELLDASGRTRETPIALYVLHLIELRGRATPIFISHRVQKRTVADRSYSENVILAFSRYERNNWGAVTLQAFTAISPRKLMYEDICTLALDTLASIIILPFHKQWGTNGTVEAEDHSLRALNSCVLDRAPCSIGILVDNGNLKRSNSVTLSGLNSSGYRVAMVFIGGKDDQEALVFAKRSVKSENVTLTVLRIASVKGSERTATGHDEDNVLDSEVLSDVRFCKVGNRYVHYVEELVNEGSETAVILRHMVNEFDLIIVGRRHNVKSPQTTGFEVWSEYPELGVVGDLLVSSDFKGRASILVVQQQQITHS